MPRPLLPKEENEDAREQTSLPFALDRDFVLAVTGFASLYAVAIVFFYCDWLFDVPGADPVVYGVALNSALCASGVSVFAGAIRNRLPMRPAALAGLVAYGVALASLLAVSMGAPIQMAYLSGAAAGAGVGALMPLWFARLGALSGNRYALGLGVGSLACSLLALALDALPIAVLVVGCVVLVVVATVPLVRVAPLPGFVDKMSERGGGVGSLTAADAGTAEVRPLSDAVEPRRSVFGLVDESGDSRPSTALVIPGLYTLILSFAYGMLDVVAMASPVADPAISGAASQVGGLASIIAFIVYVGKGGRRYAVLLNASLVAVATGALFLPFFPQGYSVALVVLAHMGWEVALLVLYSLTIGVNRHHAASLVGWGALAFALPRPALLAGSLTASALSSEGRFPFTQMVIVAFALLYLIALGVALLRNREHRAYQRVLRRKDEAIARYRAARSDLQVVVCEELATTYGLTKREGELLLLFAQGRDAAYAERTLFLSRNTVKSYRKSLYAKLGVHSKQELIDRVNDAMSADE